MRSSFAVQTGIAVAVGKVVSFLPTEVVQVVATLLFLAGAFLLFRESRNADEEEAETENEFSAKRVLPVHDIVAGKPVEFGVAMQ